MKYRKLRIAWSVAWGVVAVLFVVLWVRSYWWWDNVAIQPYSTYAQNIVSFRGQITIVAADAGTRGKLFQSLPVFYDELPSILDLPNEGSVFELGVDLGVMTLRFPDWFAVVLASSLAGLPWLHCAKRFSLRTLLIAMTLIALGLGLVAWMVG